MNRLSVEIETLMLDGTPLPLSATLRVANLAGQALQQMLIRRGITSALAQSDKRKDQTAEMKAPANANEVRWAEQLAEVLYQTLDRKG